VPPARQLDQRPPDRVRQAVLDQEMPESDAGQSALAIRDRVEHAGRRAFRIKAFALRGEDRRDCVHDLARERNLDEDQGLVEQRGMKERIAASVFRIDATA